MENTQTTSQNENVTVVAQVSPTVVQVPLTFNLDLSMASYNEGYRIRSGAAAQLIRGVHAMLERVSVDKETDEYKKSLYPKLRNIATQLIDRFMMLLKANNQTEHDMRRFNLFGYDGQVRPDRMGRYPFVKGVNPNTKYAFANFGYFIKMLRQRAEFIAFRETPQRYLVDENLKAQFAALKTDANGFLEFLNTQTEPEWNAAVVAARESGGVPVQQNLEQRVKTQTDRKEQYKNTKAQANRPVKKPTHVKQVMAANVPMCNHEQCHQNCKQVCGQTARAPKPMRNSEYRSTQYNKAVSYTPNTNKRFTLPKWVNKPVAQASA